MRPLTRFALRRSRGWRRRTEGTAAVEFAILGMVFLMIIGGVMDFGHAWYIRQVVTNASREGAHYGAYYLQHGTTDRIKPTELSPSISDYVSNNVLNNTGITATVTPGGAGYTDGIRGHDLQVTVSTTKTWWLLGPILGSSTTVISSTTTMKLE